MGVLLMESMMLVARWLACWLSVHLLQSYIYIIDLSANQLIIHTLYCMELYLLMFMKDQT
jgi:hypothetical protein